jgi:hypothetical protein
MAAKQVWAHDALPPLWLTMTLSRYINTFKNLEFLSFSSFDFVIVAERNCFLFIFLEMTTTCKFQLGAGMCNNLKIDVSRLT